MSVVTIAGCTGDSSSDGDDMVIVPGTNPGFPPFEMKEGGDLVGFDIDLLEAVVAETEYELGEWEEMEFSSLIPALEQGRIDVVAAAMTITEERDETIDFTDSYISSDMAILVSEDGSFSPSEVGDLDGSVIGAEEGSTGEELANQWIDEETIDAEYNGYNSYVLAIEDLENGNIDAVIVGSPTANTFNEQRAVEISFIYETGDEFAFGIQDGDSELQQALNDGLEAVEESGEYEEIRDEWFGLE